MCVLLCMVTTFRVGYTCMLVLLTDIISTTGSQKDETKFHFSGSMKNRILCNDHAVLGIATLRSW